jgi:hypothetical protein
MDIQDGLNEIAQYWDSNDFASGDCHSLAIALFLADGKK